MRVDCWQRYWKLSLTYMLNISFLNIYPTYMFCFLITYIWIFIILGGIFNEATTLLACVLCVWGVSCLGWPPNYKHSVLPDRERLHVCRVFWSTSSLLLFFAVIGKILFLFLSPIMHCCLYQAAQEEERCWDVKFFHTFCSSIFSLCVLCNSLPFTPLYSSNL